MLSRRSFLKTFGVATAAIGTGFGTGELLKTKTTGKSFSMYGFLPGDEKIINEVVGIFNKKSGNSFTPVIFAESKFKPVIERSFNPNKYSLLNNGKVVVRLVKLNEKVDGDILLSDNKNIVYNPEEDFNGSLIWLRKKLKNQKAEYFFSAEYKEENLFSSLVNGNEKIAVIKNEKGIVDKIDLKKSYKNIFVNGPQGKTGIRFENGSVHVHTATCRHAICKYSGFASDTGNVIACAPNKVLIRIEKV